MNSLFQHILQLFSLEHVQVTYTIYRFHKLLRDQPTTGRDVITNNFAM